MLEKDPRGGLVEIISYFFPEGFLLPYSEQLLQHFVAETVSAN
jgi:hypothetical protein